MHISVTLVQYLYTLFEPDYVAVLFVLTKDFALVLFQIKVIFCDINPDIILYSINISISTLGQ